MRIYKDGIMDILRPIESAILLFLQGLRNPVTDPIMAFFSISANYGIVWIVLALVLLCIKKTRMAGLSLALCLIASLLVNNILLKPLVARPRPFHEIEGLRLMLETGPANVGGWSFPSGHTGASFAAACSLTRSYGKKGAWVYAVAVLIAFSRLYIGAHYPTDVLAGMVTGTLGAVLAVFLLHRAVKALRARRSRN
jgi:undecaprenyl-diphosphatase